MVQSSAFWACDALQLAQPRSGNEAQVVVSFLGLNTFEA